MRGDPPRKVLDGGPEVDRNRKWGRNGRSQERPRNRNKYEKRFKTEKRYLDDVENDSGPKMGPLGDFKVTISNNRESGNQSEEETTTTSRTISTGHKSTGSDRTTSGTKVKISGNKPEVEKSEIRSKLKNDEPIKIDEIKPEVKPEVTYQITRDELDDLEEMVLPSGSRELNNLAKNGRDRDNRTPLMIILEWKNVKAFLNSFTPQDFEPVLAAVKRLREAGVNPQVKDRDNKTAAHYLAQWKFNKEKVKDPKDLQLPRRVREILQEIGYKECQSSRWRSKETPPCLLDTTDSDGNNFLHSLLTNNYKEKSSDHEKACLVQSVRRIFGGLKLPSSVWTEKAKSGLDLKSLCFQNGLFNSQQFEKLQEAASTSKSRSKEERKDKKEKSKLSPERRVRSPEVVPNPARRVSLGQVKRPASPEKRPEKRPVSPSVPYKGSKPSRPHLSPYKGSKSLKSPERPKSRNRTISKNSEKVKISKRRESSTSGNSDLTDSEHRPLPVQKKERTVSRNSNRDLKRKTSRDYTDNESAEDVLDIGITADDFIEDAIQLIPKSKRPTSPKRRKRSKSPKRRRRDASPKKRRSLTPVKSRRPPSPVRAPKRRSPFPRVKLSRSPTPRRHSSQSDEPVRSASPNRNRRQSPPKYSPNIRRRRSSSRSASPVSHRRRASPSPYKRRPMRQRSSPDPRLASPPSKRRASPSPPPKRRASPSPYQRNRRNSSPSPRKRVISSPLSSRRSPMTQRSPVRRNSTNRNNSSSPRRSFSKKSSPPPKRRSPNPGGDRKKDFILHEKRRGKLDRKDYARKGEISLSPVRQEKSEWGQVGNKINSPGRSLSRSPLRNFERLDEDYRNKKTKQTDRSRDKRPRSRGRDNKFMRLANY